MRKVGLVRPDEGISIAYVVTTEGARRTHPARDHETTETRWCDKCHHRVAHSVMRTNRGGGNAQCTRFGHVHDVGAVS
ncbi:MAG TPA: hypothetical protein VK585_10120 [Jiangellaceae bacterium]|nr:hypothetical protein [Jiangellaceae bacterium]